eukprot:TRINITY_DN8570_c1_g1_i1.p1 TRINITY_DN8570_c1_g1~~TRINITY_DN8570_c1_g1_i1.p1  ORF type:complete len:264 (-),score=41.62 TRINITY_DN8570_c1_g1_i1:51-842(-)
MMKHDSRLRKKYLETQIQKDIYQQVVKVRSPELQKTGTMQMSITRHDQRSSSSTGLDKLNRPLSGLTTGSRQSILSRNTTQVSSPRRDKLPIQSGFKEYVPSEPMEEGEIFFRNEGEIRKMLHPELEKFCLHNQELWVPGNLSETKAKRPLSAVSHLHTHSRFYGRYTKDFKKFDEEEQPNSKSTTRVSSAYKSQFDLRREEDKERDSRVIGPRVFYNYSGKSLKPNFIENYVARTVSQNPNDHKFRDVDRSRWVVQSNFKVR